MVSTLDSESKNLSSNLGRTSLCFVFFNFNRSSFTPFFYNFRSLFSSYQTQYVYNSCNMGTRDLLNINKFKPTIDSGLLCLYKEWHHLQVWIKVLFSQGITYLYPGKIKLSSFQGYIRFVSLLFPLICPRKVVHGWL